MQSQQLKQKQQEISKQVSKITHRSKKGVCGDAMARAKTFRNGGSEAAKPGSKLEEDGNEDETGAGTSNQLGDMSIEALRSLSAKQAKQLSVLQSQLRSGGAPLANQVSSALPSASSPPSPLGVRCSPGGRCSPRVSPAPR